MSTLKDRLLFKKHIEAFSRDDETSFIVVPDPAFYALSQGEFALNQSFLIYEAVNKNAWKSLRKILEHHPSIAIFIESQPSNIQTSKDREEWYKLTSTLYYKSIRHVNKDDKTNRGFLKFLLEINHLDDDIVFCFLVLCKDEILTQARDVEAILSGKSPAGCADHNTLAYLSPWVAASQKREEIKKNRSEILDRIGHSENNVLASKKSVL